MVDIWLIFVCIYRKKVVPLHPLSKLELSKCENE